MVHGPRFDTFHQAYLAVLHHVAIQRQCTTAASDVPAATHHHSGEPDLAAPTNGPVQ